MIAVVEVDVAVARPPSPANIRTVRVVIDGVDDADCMLGACQIAQVTRSAVVMPTASRIVSVTI